MILAATVLGAFVQLAYEDAAAPGPSGQRAGAAASAPAPVRHANRSTSLEFLATNMYRGKLLLQGSTEWIVAVSLPAFCPHRPQTPSLIMGMQLATTDEPKKNVSCDAAPSLPAPTGKSSKTLMSTRPSGMGFRYCIGR